jgi:hypothetical protein
MSEYWTNFIDTLNNSENIKMNKEGVIIKEYKNMSEASRDSDISVNNIKKSATKNIVIDNEYIFKFK